MEPNRGAAGSAIKGKSDRAVLSSLFDVGDVADRVSGNGCGIVNGFFF